jgi:hypothetical protein
VTIAAAIVAWAGAAIITLADGRRGLALGIAIVAIGFGALAIANGGWFGGGVLIAGGAVSAIQLARKGNQDWGLMPAGSTPRMILAVVTAILALWVAASLTTGPGGSLRFASVAVLGLMAARLLQAPTALPVLTAAAALAIALAGASGIGTGEPGPAPYVAGALIAAGASFLPAREPRGA